MTQDSFSLHYKICSQKIELIKLKAEEIKLQTPGYFDSTKLFNVKSDIEYVNQSIKDYENLLADQVASEETYELKELAEDAYFGDTEALEKLIALSKNNPEVAAEAKTILINLAEMGDSSIAKLLLDAFGKDGAMLSALVIGNSAYATQAAENIAEYFGPDGQSSAAGVSSTGGAKNTNVEMTPGLQEVILEHLCKDTERNIHRIAKYSHTERGAATLSDIAITKPTTYAGGVAARALGKAFMEGNTKVSNYALEGLKSASIAGNTEAVNTLANIVTSPKASMNKAVQALDALAEVAGSAAQAGSEGSKTAMGAIIGIANNNNVSSKLRTRAIDHLGTLIMNGNDPNMNATDALINLARNSNNPNVAKSARENIFMAAEHNPQVLDRSVDLLHDVAKGYKSANKKTRLQAVDLLGKAYQLGGENANKAKDSLVLLSKNPDGAIARRSVETMKKQGLAINKDEALIKPGNAEEVENKDAKRLQSKDFMILS